MRLKSTFLFLFICGLSNYVFSQNFKNEFGFKSDNDAYLFYGQDRYYTNGLFIYFRHATNQLKLGDKLEKLTYEISAGQKMYNSISGNRPDPAKQDRPFAGYLYAGGNLNFFYKNERVFKADLQLGTVGPDALGEDAQKLLHKVVGFYKIDGWDYQIKNEFAVNAEFQYLQLLHRSANQKVDFSLDAYANLGTTYNATGVGVLFRTGNINQLFNSVSTQALITNNSKTDKLVKNELFFYTKPQISYIAFDATVSGSLFTNDSPVTFGTKPFVFSQQLGFNYSTPRFTIDYGLTFKSREIKSTAKPHQYGTIAMFYRFN